MNKEYLSELELLKRERLLKEQIVDSYKNKLIEDLLNESPILHEVKEIPKKSFWKKLFSSL